MANKFEIRGINPEKDLESGMKLARERKDHEAVRLLRPLYDLLPVPPDVLDQLGSCYSRLGDHEESLRFSRAATQAAPGVRQFMSNYAINLVRAGRKDEARSALEGALAIQFDAATKAAFEEISTDEGFDQFRVRLVPTRKGRLHTHGRLSKEPIRPFRGLIQRRSMLTATVAVVGLVCLVGHIALGDPTMLVGPLRTSDVAMSLCALFNLALVFDNRRHNGGNLFSSRSLLYWIFSASGLRFLSFQVVVLALSLVGQATPVTYLIFSCWAISVLFWAGAPPVALVLACSGPSGSQLAAFVNGLLFPLRSIHLLNTGASRFGHPNLFRVLPGIDWRASVRYFQKEARFIVLDARILCDGAREEVSELLAQEALQEKTLFIIDSGDGRAILLDIVAREQPHLSILPSSKVTMLGAGVRIARKLSFAESLWRPWEESLDPETGLYL